MLVGALVLINGALGVVASMSNSHNLFIIHLVLSVLSFLSSIALAITAYLLHFEPIGKLSSFANRNQHTNCRH